MTIEEKYDKAIEALKKIAAFGHTNDCSGGAPVYECCCYDKDQWTLAREVLAELEPEEE